MVTIKKNMLRLKTHHQIHFPSLHSRSMQLSVVSSDDDELTRAIDSEQITHDDTWTLTPSPDTNELEQFWSGVEDDIKNDPDWFKFDDE